MLTVFILTTTEPNRSVTKTLNSMDNIPIEFRSVESIKEINDDRFKTDWYMVLFDNEYLSYDLRKALEKILQMDIQFDVLVFVKKTNDDKMYQSPRLFKKHVNLAKDSLLPADRSIKIERILDGWIYEHVA